MLSWTQPCHPKGIITKYRIKIHINDSIDNQGRFTNNNNTLNTNNNSTNFNVTNLLPYRSYVFTVYTEVEGVKNLSEQAVSKPFQTDTEGIWFFIYIYNLLWFSQLFYVYFLTSLYMFLQHHIHPWKFHSVTSHQILCKYGGNIQTFKLVPQNTKL